MPKKFITKQEAEDAMGGRFDLSESPTVHFYCGLSVAGSITMAPIDDTPVCLVLWVTPGKVVEFTGTKTSGSFTIEDSIVKT